MSDLQLARRALLKIGGGVWASALAGASLSTAVAAALANREQAQFARLSPDLAAGLEAIAARIIPTTETPGAREAGAVWFMDAMLAEAMSDALPSLQMGLAALDSRAGAPFATLAPDAQDALLREIDDGEFFGLVHLLTVAGTLTMSRYGGNRGEVGWDMLGLERQHAWSAPFGYYDRDAHGSPTAALPGTAHTGNTMSHGGDA